MKKIKNFVNIVLLIICAFIFTLLLKDVVNNKQIAFDNTVSQFLQSARTQEKTIFMNFISNFVGIYIPIAICAFSTIIIKNKKIPIAISLNLIAIALLNLFLKNLITRTRPEYAIAHASGFSFPSGHAASSAAFYGLLIYQTAKFEKGAIRNCFITIFSLAIILVGISRIYLGVHYPSDVIAGLCVAYIYLNCFIYLFNLYKTRNLKRLKLRALKLIKSFGYATSGVFLALKTEQNLKIHFIIAYIVFLVGIFFSITKMEWIILIILYALVIGAELINTSLEKLCDLYSTKKDQRIKLIKDISAAFVMIFAIASVIIGLLIFVPYLVK